MPWEKTKDKENGNGYTTLSQLGFYNTTKWIKIRNYILNKEPFCRICKKNKKNTPATLVDHIIPVDEFSSNELKFGIQNLQPLCDKCHTIKTNTDRGRKNPQKLRNGKKIMDDLEK